MENKDITRNNQNSVENIDCDKNCQPSTVNYYVLYFKY